MPRPYFHGKIAKIKNYITVKLPNINTPPLSVERPVVPSGVLSELARGALVGGLYTQVMVLPVRAPRNGSSRDAGRAAVGAMEGGAADEEERPWNITRVFAGDGSSAVSGETFRTARFYAAASMNGGAEHFHEIDITSLRVKTRGSERPSFSVAHGTEDSKKKPLPKLLPKVRIFKRDGWARRERLIRRAISRYCLQNPGFAVLFGSPGRRTVRSGDLTRVIP